MTDRTKKGMLIEALKNLIGQLEKLDKDIEHVNISSILAYEPLPFSAVNYYRRKAGTKVVIEFQCAFEPDTYIPTIPPVRDNEEDAMRDADLLGSGVWEKKK